MPYSSISELPEQFHGLPERGKRIAVHIMNLLEEQGLMGDAATQKAMAILGQLFNKGVGQNWSQTPEKIASLDSILEGAQLLSFLPVPGLQTLGNAAWGIKTVKDSAKEAINAHTPSNFDAQKMTYASVKETLMNRIIKFDPNWTREKVAEAVPVLSEIEFNAAKVAFVQRMWKDMSSRDIPMRLATYNTDGEKTASAKLVSSRDFVQAFPKIANVMDTLGRFAQPTMDTLVGKIVPLAAAMGLANVAHDMYNSFKQNRAYNAMFDNYPELKDADPARIERLYQVISTYSPTVAKDPIGSGAMIKTMLNYPDALDISMIKGLIDLERGSGVRGFDAIMDAAARNTGVRLTQVDPVEGLGMKAEKVRQLLEQYPEDPTDPNRHDLRHAIQSFK